MPLADSPLFVDPPAPMLRTAVAERIATSLGDLDPDLANWPTTLLQRWPFTGPPTTGIWPLGWLGVDDTATVWICTAGGEPGTWQPLVQELDWVTPQMFGAVADGVHDDTAAIQEALNTAATRMPPGRYLVSETLTIPADGSLQGVNEWPPFFTPNTGTIIVVDPSMTDPILSVAAGINFWSVKGIAFAPTSGTTTAPVLAVNGTATQGCGQFLVQNIVGQNTGGMTFEYANRFELVNINLQDWQGNYGFHFDNCTIARWDWLSAAAGGVGTAETAPWAAGFYITNSGSIVSVSIATTGAAYYGLWVNVLTSSTFVVTEINGAAQDAYHLMAGPGGDNRFIRIYNNGNCVNGLVMGTNANSSGWEFNGGSVGNFSGQGILINPASSQLNDVRFIGVKFDMGATAGPLIHLQGNIARILFSSCQWVAGTNNPLILVDDSTNSQSFQNVMVGCTCSRQGARVTIPTPNANGFGWHIVGNSGINPLGPQTAPAVPASGTAFRNPFPVDCMVTVTGGTVTAVAIGGTPTGLTAGTFRVPSTQSITITYTTAPSWTWFGD